MKIIMIIIMFLLLGAFFIISNNNLALIEKENQEIFLEKYISWLSGLGDNSKQTIGYVIKMEWLPQEASAEI